MHPARTDPYTAQHYAMPLGFNGRWAGLYRWLAGRPMNGHRYTDATFWHYGTMALDPSGRASSYHLLPGRLRFLYFRAPVMALPAYALSWLIWPVATYLATLGLVLVATWRVDVWRRRRAFRRAVIEPVSAGVSSAL